MVGAQGSGLNRLRDALGVKVDVSDDAEEKEKEAGRRKKTVHQKSKFKVAAPLAFFLPILTAAANRLQVARKT